MYRLALIGNGPSALAWQAGRFIDRFPEVVRCNNYTTEGFERWVGSKLTTWVRNDTKGVWDRDAPAVLNICRPDRPKNGYLRPKTYPGGWLSTGVAAAVHYLKQGRCVWLHGFDFFTAPKHHYFGSSSQNKHHDPAEDYAAILPYLETGHAEIATDNYLEAIRAATVTGRCSQAHYHDLLYYAATAEKTLCIGGHTGGAALLLGMVAKMHGGKSWTIDPWAGSHDRFYPHFRLNLMKYRVHNHVEVIRQPSQGVDFTERVDVAFVDGDLHEEPYRRDLAMCLSLGATVVTFPRPNSNPKRVADPLAATKVLTDLAKTVPVEWLPSGLAVVGPYPRI